MNAVHRIGIALVVLWVVLIPASLQPPSPKPHIVFILIDGALPLTLTTHRLSHARVQTGVGPMPVGTANEAIARSRTHTCSACWRRVSSWTATSETASAVAMTQPGCAAVSTSSALQPAARSNLEETQYT